MIRPKVNLVADFNDRGGWGRHARGFSAGLQRYVDLAICGSNSSIREDHRPDGDVQLDATHPISEENIGIGLGSISFIPQVLGSPRIIYTVWETSRVPESQLQALRQADHIWVPTHWGREVFMQSGIDGARIQVVPEGVDANLFRPAERMDQTKPFQFVCVGKWEVRKGTADLVRAFVEEFDASEDVELVMHCDNIYMPRFDLASAIAAEVAVAGGNGPSVHAHHHGSLESLIILLQQSDAFVLPTRAEAWGLPILEAMACELPCIVTDYSGHRAFANESNSYLIPVEQQCAVFDPLNFSPALDWGTWAEPDFGRLRQILRHVFENREEAREIGRQARRDAIQYWSWDNAGKTALGHLTKLGASSDIHTPSSE